MSDSIRRFEFQNELEVRVDMEDGEPWFVLNDVCRALAISNSRDVASRLKEQEKGVGSIDTPGGPQQMTLISEAGLYRAIFRSRKEQAKAFQDWVFEEVLPEIRQHGEYKVVEAKADEVPRPPVKEREVRHPDGRVVIERYQVGHVTHREVRGAPSQRRSSIESNEVVEPNVPVGELRSRFYRAFHAAIADLPEYQRLNDVCRGNFIRSMNAKLKAFIGRKRADWEPLDYSNGVHWLRFQYGMDIRWVLNEANGEVSHG